MNSYEIIKNDLIKLGVKKGDVIMLHSSLSSMKYVDGGANTLIQALLDVVTPTGTLLLPSFIKATTCFVSSSILIYPLFKGL